MTRTLILGGARSGKSRHAEQLALASGKELIYIATAQARDAEMAARIELHRRRREADGEGGGGDNHGAARWITVEQPLALGDALAQWCAPQRLVLVDCLTVWLSNLLFAEARDYPEIGRIDPPACFAPQRAAFLQALAQAGGDVVLVSNEVGSGIVPQGAVSRWFVDEAGRLHQAAAAICERVVLVAAGLPLALKG
jgi:adenosylcobinamide kinase/adenosylcobinamide-phosphate guanylyltransferase